LSRFDELRRDISGRTWLDDLARASLVAAAAKFDGVRTPFLAVDVGTEIDAEAFAIIASSVQDAVARVGRRQVDPRAKANTVRAADRERARLFVRRQMGRRVEFGFENPDVVDPVLIGDHPVALQAERAALELAALLPETADDTDSVQAMPARERASLNAIRDIVQVVRETGDIAMHVVTHEEERNSVLTSAQAQTIAEDLSEPEVETDIKVVNGRLDGVRTRRRVFYFETIDGRTFEGGFEQDLSPIVKRFLDEPATAVIQRVRFKTKTGVAGRWSYRLLELRGPETRTRDGDTLL
jgi:hypothetical protein